MMINLDLILKRVIEMAQSPFIHIFMFVIILDILTGIVKGLINKNLDSRIGTAGMLKHVLVVIVVLFIAVYLPLFGFLSWARTIVVFFIAQYSLSIIENWGEIGLPLPSFIKDVMERFRDQTDQGIDPFKKE